MNRPGIHINPYVLKNHEQKVIGRTSHILVKLSTEYTQQKLAHTFRSFTVCVQRTILVLIYPQNMLHTICERQL